MHLILIRAKFVHPVCLFRSWQHAIAQQVMTQPAIPLLAARHDHCVPLLCRIAQQWRHLGLARAEATKFKLL